MRIDIWQLIKDLGTAVVAVVITLYLLTQTNYLYHFHSGIGPVEFGIIVLLFLYLWQNIEKIPSFIKRAFTEKQLTVVDRLFIIVVLWAGLFRLVLEIFTSSFSIDWQRLFGLVLLTRVVLVLSVLWLVSRLIGKIHRWYTQTVPTQKLFLFSDEAAGVHAEDKDLIGRENIINQVVSVVRDYEPQGAFVVAITGEWGSGKTTVINYVLKELSDMEGLITILFDPWYFSDSDNQSLDILLRRFFDALEAAIKSHVFKPNMSRLINKYYKAISPIMDRSPLKLDVLFDYQTKDLQTLKAELETVFTELDQRIVVIIDDLDRMDGAEIAYIFKLIRLCADFSNFTYIVAFDDHFVQNQLNKEFGVRAKDYVDKIVQLNLALPKIDPIILGNIFEQSFAELDEQQGTNLLQDQHFINRLRTIFNPYILFMLSNLRLIKRFLNRYFLVLPILKDEVNCFDLFVLELIHLRYSRIYETIYANPQYFTYKNSINWAILGQQQASSQAKKHIQEALQTEKFYESMLSDLNLNNEEKEVVFTLLGAVFNSVQSFHHKSNVFNDASQDLTYRRLKSAAHRDYFPRYFYLNVQQGVFPDAYWDEFLRQLNGATGDDLEFLIYDRIDSVAKSGMTQEWIRRMNLSVLQINTDNIPNLVFALAKNIECFSNERHGIFNLSEVDHMTFLIASLLERIELEELNLVVLNLVNTSLNFGFIIRLLDLRAGKSEEPGKATKFAQLDFDSLKQRTGERLKEHYIDSEKQNLLIDTDNRALLYALTELLNPHDYQPYIHKLLSKDQRNALHLLSTLISRNSILTGDNTITRSYRVFNYKLLKKLIDPQSLISVINNLPQEISLSDDEEWALNALKESFEKEAQGEKVERIREFNQI